MSRLVVKNLPKDLKEEQLRNLFSKKGDVTDCTLKYTKDGVFRKFAFVGYKTSAQAQDAVKYFNKSFIKTSKIQVEIARDLNDPNKARPWSKHSRGSSAYQKLHDTEKPYPEKPVHNKAENKSNKVVDELLGELKDDPEFQEFAEIHQSRSSKPLWVDDVGPSTRVARSDETSPTVQKQDSDDNEEVSVSHQIVQEHVQEQFCVQLKGVSPGLGEQEIREFFKPLNVTKVDLSWNKKLKKPGLVQVEFQSEQEMEQALRRNKLKLGGKRIFLKKIVKHDEKPIQPVENEEPRDNQYEVNADIIIETGRLFLRNLSYTCTEEDLQELFSKLGPLTDISLPIDKKSKKVKGFAIITFLMPEHAVKAYSQLDGTVFQGRMLHIIPGKAPKDEDPTVQEGSSYKQKKADQAKKTASSSHNWNSLFLGASAVADVMADKFNASKQQILDVESSQSLGVRMALGETQIVSETRNFLLNNGISLDAFSQPAAARSKTVILVKNLPSCTTCGEIEQLFQKHGRLKRVVLPPHGITAVVEFDHGAEAKAAFTSLAYTKFQHIPLFLEWAPVGIFTTTEKSSDAKADKEGEEEDDDSEIQEGCTLFVKNINFDTTKSTLMEIFSKCGPLKDVVIATKKDPKNPGGVLSMGYGFVEFMDPASLQKALKTLQHTEVDGHTLELKLSERTTTAAVKTTRKVAERKRKPSTKILVRNIPFEAKAHEVKELFRVFGELKTVRLPKKVQGTSSHRGFGFVDFVTKQDAKRAFESLVHSTHLYGRRLVLEWADVNEESVDSLRRKTAQHFTDVPTKKLKKGSLKQSLESSELGAG